MSELIQRYKEKPTRLVAHVWYTTMFLTVCDVIAACATASTNDDAGSAGSRGGAFAAIWAMFTVVAYVVGGTYILRHHKTSSAIGVLLGASFMISQLFFVLFVIFASFASKAAQLDDVTNETTSAAGADRWFAAFAFFLFIITMVFGLVLGKFRHDGIIPVSEMDAHTAAGLSQPMAGAGVGGGAQKPPATTAV
mmetsp:Transcript_18253/g.37232  ORF Transcript_18253/g.37232 Transcript_18253/m.37232 type:complete len:194 (-) Transcript_18253:57-638(-)